MWHNQQAEVWLNEWENKKNRFRVLSFYGNKMHPPHSRLTAASNLKFIIIIVSTAHVTGAGALK